MRFTLIAHVTATDPAARLSDAGLAHTREVLAATPGVTMARLYTPATARDLYTDDGPSPALAFQLYFDELTALEAAAGPAGPLRALADGWRDLPGATVAHQAMLVRAFPVPEPKPGGTPEACSYLVHYPGAAEDLNAWLTYYIAHHPRIMATFPGVREIEILTRVDWCDALPWQRVAFMQRNRLMFDSPAALEAALQSPVRHVMRADFENFPPFEGSNLHFPMFAETLTLAG
ncbi:hypothetical protein FDP22_21930 (plasmid) [Paroceanicella profunda]|uniref:Ethyl tert-butyl ether degradation protein EthD n=1 Tax=Paroceanicella profunda TaxID=2579971 RepID=A0A5B8FJ58_9RHOB|nr:hypothetical protein [Paroceanicella profunda]QDL94541.1 hypothetical protein FDP22_21930 [Paroceanicella profunda]